MPEWLQAKNEFQVPMWIWCSQTYRENHPEILSNIIASQHKPFLTDDIPQILLYLAGISSEWTDEHRNLLSSKYKSKPRIIVGTTDYDKLKP
jgi:heptose-I-phosphate ethanolaminephosphotransferase